MSLLHSTVYVGDNSHVVDVWELVDADGVPQVDATVTLVTIVDAKTETPVSGVVFPLLLAHIEDGHYRAVLPHGGGFIENRGYFAKITAISSAGFRAEWEERIIAKERNA